MYVDNDGGRDGADGVHGAFGDRATENDNKQKKQYIL